MKLSARNQIKGKVAAVQKGQTTAHVRIDIGNGSIVTASAEAQVRARSDRANSSVFAVPLW